MAVFASVRMLCMPSVCACQCVHVVHAECVCLGGGEVQACVNVCVRVLCACACF